MRSEKNCAMRSDADKIWTGICDKLQPLVNREIFNLWFARISPVSTADGVLTLSVPDEFCQIWIEDNYAGLLRDLAAQVSAQTAAVRVVVTTAATARAELKASGVGGGKESGPGSTASAPARDAEPTRNTRPRAGSAKSAPPVFNPKNIFETFVVGPGNNFAHAAALAVAQSPGQAYNPLFIYGGTGLGKTHLIQAIGSDVTSRQKKAHVVYISCETFINEFIDAIQNRSLIGFRRKYRHADLLLIDDVHFLSGKERLQEEFFHTFNALFESRKQIVLSSDRPVSEIANLEKRLVSRFEWGLVTEILAPDYETRLAILRKKLETLHVAVDSQILEFIAHRITSNIRRLEGALVRVASYTSLSGKPLDLPAVAHLLRDTLEQETQRLLSVETIQKMVAQHFDIRLADMTSKRRPQTVAFPRQVAMFMSRRHTNCSLVEIGEKFGNRDHGTVLHACRTIQRKLESDTALRQTLEFLDQQLHR
jgi:chromosomal replication initiator protein